MTLAPRTYLSRIAKNSTMTFNYRIAGNFCWVLIFAISQTVYGVAKIKTAIIYSVRNSKVGSFEITKIKIAKIISHIFIFKSRKFSSAKISRYTVCQRSRYGIIKRSWKYECFTFNTYEVMTKIQLFGVRLTTKNYGGNLKDG